MSCIVLRVMLVDIILSVSPSNWGKVSNSTMRGCKAKGGQGQRPPRGRRYHCNFYFLVVGESMEDVLVDLYIDSKFELDWKGYLISTSAARSPGPVGTGEVGRLGLALCWFVTWTFVTWVPHQTFSTDGEWLGLYQFPSPMALDLWCCILAFQDLDLGTPPPHCNQSLHGHLHLATGVPCCSLALGKSVACQQQHVESCACIYKKLSFCQWLALKLVGGCKFRRKSSVFPLLFYGPLAE